VAKVSTNGTVAHAQALTEAGVIPKLVHLLSLADKVLVQKDKFLALNAALALGRLADKSPCFRDTVLRAEIMPPLLRLLKLSNESSVIMIVVSWVIATLCAGDPKPDFSLVKPCLEPLSHLLLSDDEMVLKNSCSALGIFCCSSEYAIDVGIYPRLVQILGHSSEEVQDYALKTISCLVERDRTLLQHMISNEVLPGLITSMSSPHSSIQFSASRIIYEISGGSKQQIRAVVSQGCVRSFCSLFTSSDSRTVKLGLGGLWKVLEFGRQEYDQTVNNIIRDEIIWIKARLGELKNEFERQNFLEIYNALKEEVDMQKALLLNNET